MEGTHKATKKKQQVVHEACIPFFNSTRGLHASAPIGMHMFTQQTTAKQQTTASAVSGRNDVQSKGLECLRDGSFMGEFWTYLVDQPTEVDYVPPEAHHRLGKAERCNAVYREMLNRVVDSMAVVTDEDMELAIDATTHAINSMPRTRGMSAYAIVFGRVPRVPGELLTDDASLAATVPMEDHNRHTIIFRAEAQKAAAQVNVDQHIRRALLRKTAHMRVEDITLGAKCAVWRSQLRGKGPRKRGG